jgi:hypothetical protein
MKNAERDNEDEKKTNWKELCINIGVCLATIIIIGAGVKATKSYKEEKSKTSFLSWVSKVSKLNNKKDVKISIEESWESSGNKPSEAGDKKLPELGIKIGEESWGVVPKKEEDIIPTTSGKIKLNEGWEAPEEKKNSEGNPIIPTTSGKIKLNEEWEGKLDNNGGEGFSPLIKTKGIALDEPTGGWGGNPQQEGDKENSTFNIGVHLNAESWGSEINQNNGTTKTIIYNLEGEGWKPHKPQDIISPENATSTPEEVKLGAIHLNTEGWQPKNSYTKNSGKTIVTPQINYNIGGEGWKPHKPQDVTSPENATSTPEEIKLGAIHLNTEGWQTKITGVKATGLDFGPGVESWRPHQKIEEPSTSNQTTSNTEVGIGVIKINKEGWQPLNNKTISEISTNNPSYFKFPQLNYGVGGEAWKPQPTQQKIVSNFSNNTTTQKIEIGAIKLNGEGWKAKEEDNKIINSNPLLKQSFYPQISYNLDAEAWNPKKFLETKPSNRITGKITNTISTKPEIGAVKINSEGWKPQDINIERNTSEEKESNGAIPNLLPLISYNINGEGWKNHTETNTNKTTALLNNPQQKKTEIGAVTLNSEGWKAQHLEEIEQYEKNRGDAGIITIPTIKYNLNGEGWNEHKKAWELPIKPTITNTKEKLEIGAVNLSGEAWKAQKIQDDRKDVGQITPYNPTATIPSISYNLGYEGWRPKTTEKVVGIERRENKGAKSSEIGAVNLNGEGWKNQPVEKNDGETNNKKAIPATINYNLNGENWKAQQAPTPPNKTITATQKMPRREEIGAVNLNGEAWKDQHIEEHTATVKTNNTIMKPQINYDLKGENWNSQIKKGTNILNQNRELGEVHSNKESWEDNSSTKNTDNTPKKSEPSFKEKFKNLINW